MKDKYLNLHRNPERALQYLTTRREELANTDTKTTLHLIPTIACNGLCNYCYNRPLLSNTIQSLDKTVLKQTLIDVSQDYKLDFDLIRFYGGEPGLVATQLYDYLNVIAEFSEIRSVYVSSGLLFNDKIFNELITTLKDARHAFPGSEITIGTTSDFGYSPDKYTRRCADYPINLDVIIQRVQTLLSYGFNVKMNNVLTKHVEPTLFNQQIRHALYELGKSVGIRIVFSNDDNLYPTKSILDEIYDIIVSLYNDKYFNVYSMFEYLGDSFGKDQCGKYTTIDESGEVRGSAIHCGIFTSLLTIDHEGSVVSCHYKMDERGDNLIESKHFDFMVNLRDKCLECEYLTLCCGDCVMRHAYQNEETDNAYCDWIKRSIDLSFLKHELINGN